MNSIRQYINRKHVHIEPNFMVDECYLHLIPIIAPVWYVSVTAHSVIKIKQIFKNELKSYSWNYFVTCIFQY